MNDRIGVNRDSAETEASAKSTEASAETSAESLPINWTPKSSKNHKSKFGLLLNIIVTLYHFKYQSIVVKFVSYMYILRLTFFTEIFFPNYT